MPQDRFRPHTHDPPLALFILQMLPGLNSIYRDRLNTSKTALSHSFRRDSANTMNTDCLAVLKETDKYDRRCLSFSAQRDRKNTLNTVLPISAQRDRYNYDRRCLSFSAQRDRKDTLDTVLPINVQRNR